MNRKQNTLLLFCLLLLPLLNANFSEGAEMKCFSCHDKKPFRQKNIHPPAAELECYRCHSVHVSKHEKLLAEEEASLCFSCHESYALKKETDYESHQPVEEGKCSSCHAPHSSPYSKLLRLPLASTCEQCHPRQSYSFQHAPFKDGNCLSCHDPHGSVKYALLKKDDDRLCGQCHNLSEASRLHKTAGPPVSGCLSCHDPHGGTKKNLLRRFLHPPLEDGCETCHAGGNKRVSETVCFECHDEVQEAQLLQHSHIFAGKLSNSCTACHNPHIANNQKFLKGEEIRLCTACHQHIKQRHKEALFNHPKIANCSKCHKPHGSMEPGLLTGDGNTICSQCHPSQGEFSHPVAPQAFDPRNKQPLTCITCHDPKGSAFRYQLLLNGERELCVQCHRY